MKAHLTLDHYPKSWRKKALDGEKITIPGSTIFDAYLSYWMEANPDYADQVLMRFVKSFKRTYDMLESYPRGIMRAERANREIDKLITIGLFKRKQNGEPGPSCTQKCSACCTIRVTLTDSETDLLVDYMKTRNIKMDRARVLVQDQAKTDDDYVRLPYEKRACPVLGEDGNCRAYDARPLVCRKFMVASPSWMCDTRLSGQAAIIVDPEVEAFCAAQMALERPEKLEDDNLPTQLLKRIPENDGLWK